MTLPDSSSDRVQAKEIQAGQMHAQLLVDAKPAAEVIAGGNGLRIFRKLPAGTKLYAVAPRATKYSGDATEMAATPSRPEALAASKQVTEPGGTSLEAGEPSAR